MTTNRKRVDVAAASLQDLTRVLFETYIHINPHGAAWFGIEHAEGMEALNTYDEDEQPFVATDDQTAPEGLHALRMLLARLHEFDINITVELPVEHWHYTRDTGL